MRAEVGGSVLSAPFEEGQAVAGGVVLATFDQRTLGDAVASAESDVRSAQNAVDLATRERERTGSLVKAGALADRDLELASNSVTAAQAQLESSRARLASARLQLADTVVRSPIAGIISRKHVNAGDLVSPGTAIATIIDPTSMRLDLSVPSRDLASAKVGATVVFQVRGYPGQEFTGRITRVSPVADPATRQVPIFVSIPNVGGRLVAVLFAEGRVTEQARTGLVVPQTAINQNGPKPWVLRLRSGTVERVDVTVGLRDDQNERLEITSGVSAGDQLVVGASQGIAPGTPVRVRAARVHTAS